MTLDDQQKRQLLEWLPFLEEKWEKVSPYLHYQKAPARKILLREGEVAKRVYLILKGCCRLYIIKEDGTEITVQFFFERQMVASVESALTGEPSRLYLETMEECEFLVVEINSFLKIIELDPALKEHMFRFAFERFITYSHLFTSFLLDRPEARYRNLLKEYPDIARRVEQRYLASYLGITPVSLSRIKKRIAEKSAD